MLPISKVLWLAGAGVVLALLFFYISTGAYLEQQKGMLVKLDDFLVNDDVDGTQLHPAVGQKVMSESPSFHKIIAWQDDRYGNWDIMIKRYMGGPEPFIIYEFWKVNDDAGTSDQTEPAVAISNESTFVVTWADLRNGNYDIYAQRFHLSIYLITPLGSNFRVNDDFGTSGQHNPAVVISSLDSGNFVITWEDERNGNYDIYARIYDSTGIALGPSFKVNDDAGNASQNSPQIGTDGSNIVILTWTDNRNGNPDIYARAYDFSGTPLSANFKVNDDAGTAVQSDPDIAIDLLGNLVIAWEDNRSGNYDIYAQRYNSTGTPLGGNFKANDDAGTAEQTNPAVAKDAGGNFVITWEDYRNFDPDIYAQSYDSTGVPLDTNFRVNDDIGDADQLNPDIGMSILDLWFGTFTISWEDSHNRTIDVYYMVYQFPTDAQFTPSMRVNSPVSQQSPAIALAGTGDFIILWNEYCRHPYPYYLGIYAQRYNSSGIPQDTNFMVHSNIYGVSGPDVAADSSGNFVVVWYESGGSSHEVYAQLYDYNGNPLGPEFRVNEDELGNQVWPSVAMRPDGYFVVTWDFVYNDYDIYAQRYGPGGIPLGPNFIVNDFTDSTRGSSDVAMDTNGNFVICWADNRNGMPYPDIYAQTYDFNAVPLGPNFKVNDDFGDNIQRLPAVAMNASGSFVITWEDNRNEKEEIWAQIFFFPGMPLGSNFKVANGRGEPDIAIDNSGNFVITWLDYTSETSWDAYFRRYNSSGDSILGIYQVPNLEYVHSPQVYPKVAVNDTNIFFVWIDYRRDPNISAMDYDADIFAKMVDWTWRGEAINDSLSFKGYSPIDLIVTDPAGDSIGVNFNTIPGAFYDETLDLNNDGDADDRVFILNPLVGDYLVRVVEEPGSGGGTYSLSVKINGNEDNPLVLNGTAPGPGEVDSVLYWAYPYFRGDANKDGKKTVSDVIFIINYLFKGGVPVDPLHLGDCNCDTKVTVSDVVYLINYLFKGGEAPCS